MDRAEENNLLRLLDRRIVVAASSLVALLAFGYAARQMASRIAPPLDFDMGPSTGRYLDGFTESEERLPVTFRWTREQAAIALPVEGAGSEARLKLRLARFLPGSAQVRLFVDGVIAGTFSVRSGRFRTVERSIRATHWIVDAIFPRSRPRPRTPRNRHRLDTHRERSLAPAARRPSTAVASLRGLRARARNGLFTAARARDRRMPRLRPGYMVCARPFRDGPRPSRNHRRRTCDDSSSRRRFKERSPGTATLSAGASDEVCRVVPPELLLP